MAANVVANRISFIAVSSLQPAFKTHNGKGQLTGLLDRAGKGNWLESFNDSQ